ncbi:hypothetical protein BpHYR1_054539 [Brachionus plicatilis]|uniref:Uncharacterized protein n=1 Tax=Brachionus plicatilis TaxID=10195 RepID=A0A3M7RF22_BRAPC|nr:hypothetical protein BpHYR1_054539 [Brachionus plicatilis]
MCITIPCSATRMIEARQARGKSLNKGAMKSSTMPTMILENKEANWVLPPAEKFSLTLPQWDRLLGCRTYY